MNKIKNIINIWIIFVFSIWLISNITYADQVKQDKYKKVLSVFMINKKDTDENKLDYLNRFYSFLNTYNAKIDSKNKNYELLNNLIPVVYLLKVEYNNKIQLQNKNTNLIINNNNKNINLTNQEIFDKLKLKWYVEIIFNSDWTINRDWKQYKILWWNEYYNINNMNYNYFLDKKWWNWYISIWDNWIKLIEWELQFKEILSNDAIEKDLILKWIKKIEKTKEGGMRINNKIIMFLSNYSITKVNNYVYENIIKDKNYNECYFYKENNNIFLIYGVKKINILNEVKISDIGNNVDATINLWWKNIEIWKDWILYKYIFKNYSPIISDTFNLEDTIDISKIILLKDKNNKYVWYATNFTKEKFNKIKISDIEDDVAWIVNGWRKWFWKDWLLYKYDNIGYDNSNIFIEWEYILLGENIDISKIILIKEDNHYWYFTEFTKEKLLSWYLIPDKNKEEFLKNTMYWTFEDISNNEKETIFRDIKETTINLIVGLNNKDEKIKAIYKYIIDNTNYYEDYKNPSAPKTIYSWIMTFKNKTWVCDWYAKLFLIMLSYAWIDDVKKQSWKILSNWEWHAWISIWDKYYDVTFDDPLWNYDKSTYQYRYFNLSKEEMYKDRIDY